MRVCILGGGTAGWMSAVALSVKLKNIVKSVTLIESEALGTVGVGEATLPHIRLFNQTVGIQESAFMRETEATYKLGIEFCDWGKIGQRYIHPFGDFGQEIDGVPFYQHWLKMKSLGGEEDIGAYAFGAASARKNRFKMPVDGTSEIQKKFGYAYQFDSSLYAKYLRKFAESKGVLRVEGKVVSTHVDQKNGNVRSVTLDNGQQIAAEFFIDCSGFKGVLIEQTLKSGYQDWSSWLPCNKAVAVPCENVGNLTPYTRATAKTAGWQWRIPLQHRTGNGYVYWDEFITNDQAIHQLLENLDGPALSEPKQLFFKTGRRNHFWKNNVVAIGLSSGFLEPLESTSIHLIQQGITNLIELFPVTANTQLDAKEYNDRMALEYERIRDFLLLHYVATQRKDSEMWRFFSSMKLPNSLQEKIDLWVHRAYVQSYEFGAFLPASWIAVLVGQNVQPKNYDPRVDNTLFSKTSALLYAMKNEIDRGVYASKTHYDYIKSVNADSQTIPLRAV